MSEPGVPEIPASLSELATPDFLESTLGDPDRQSEAFVRAWRSVLEQDRRAGLQPFAGPCTVLVVSESGMRLAVPCDLPNPFRADPQFQRTFLRRHVLTEAVAPTDGRFSAGGRVARLDGGELWLALEEGKTAFAAEDRPPQVASHVPGEDRQVTLYNIDHPLMSFEEIMEGVRRLKPRPWFSCGLPPMELELEGTSSELVPETEQPQ